MMLDAKIKAVAVPWQSLHSLYEGRLCAKSWCFGLDETPYPFDQGIGLQRFEGLDGIVCCFKGGQGNDALNARVLLCQLADPGGFCKTFRSQRSSLYKDQCVSHPSRSFHRDMIGEEGLIQ